MSMSVSLAQGQTARLQLIHNAADPALDTVDVYIDDRLYVEDFEFRDATSFMNVNTGTGVQIDLKAANSMPADTALDSFFLDLAASDTLVSVLSGVVDSTQFAPNPDNIDLQLSSYRLDSARDTAINSGTLDYVVFHGISDAPGVSVQARGLRSLVTDLQYGQFSSYDNLSSPGSYLLDIVLPGQPNRPLYTFRADLGGLQDSSVVLFASGFLDTAANKNGPAVALLAALPNGDVLPLPQVKKSRLQLIHASADPALDTVDVYINDSLVLDDVPRTAASPYLEIPGNQRVKVSINLSSSQGAGDRVQLVDSFFVQAEANYQLMVHGVVAPSLFTDNPNNKPTDLSFTFLEQARLEAQGQSNDVAFRFVNSMTDAAAFRLVRASDDSVFVDSTGYKDTSGYVQVKDSNQVFFLKDTAGKIVDSFALNLAQQGGKSLLIHTYGFRMPSQNGQGPGLSLLAVDAQGQVTELPRIRTAQLKLVHVAPDPRLDSVDVYLDGVRLRDDFPYQAATDFLRVSSNKVITLELVQKDATDNSKPLLQRNLQLSDNQKMLAYACGVVDPAEFNDNQNGSAAIRLSLRIIQNESLTSGNPQEADLRVIHTVPDLGQSRFRNVTEDESILTSGQFMGYREFSSVYAADPRELVVRQEFITTNTNVEGFINLDFAQGKRIYIFSTGFNVPDNNMNGPKAEFIAISGDSTIRMPSLGTARVQFVHNSPDPALRVIDIYIDGVKSSNIYDLDDVQFRTASNRFVRASNRPYEIGIAPENSNSVADTIASFNLTLEDQSFTQIFIEGVGSPQNFDQSVNNDIGLQLNLYREAQATSSDNGELNLQFHQGATDLGAVQIGKPATEEKFLDNITFGAQGGQYFSQPFGEGSQLYNVATSGANSQEVTSGIIDFEDLEFDVKSDDGTRLLNFTFFTSGFRNPSRNNDTTRLRMMAVCDRGAFLLSEGFLTNVQVINAAADPEFDSANVALNGELVIEGLRFRDNTSFGSLPVRIGEKANELALIRGNSTRLRDSIFRTEVGFQRGEDYVIIVSGLARPLEFQPNPQPYEASTKARLSILENYSRTTGDNNTVDVYYYNAITDVPALRPTITQGDEVASPDTLEFGMQGKNTGINSAASINRWRVVPGSDVLEAYQLGLDTLGGQSVVLVANGFLNPARNQVPSSKERAVYAFLSSGKAVKLDATSIGLEENSQDAASRYRFYPNPVRNVLNIERTQSIKLEKTLVRLTDLQGREIQQGVMGEGQTRLRMRVQGLSAGMYVIRLISKTHQVRQRITIR